MSDSTSLALDAENYRRDFPILDREVTNGARLIYLDNAASTQHPRAVMDAIADCYGNYYSNVHRGVHALSEASTAAYERAREILADFINSPTPRQVIFTSGCTAAINTVAQTWGNESLKRDDVVLVTLMEHHANIVPWHQLAARTGCRIEFVPLTDDGHLDIEAAEEMLDRFRPKIFAFTAVSNVLGTINPVAQLCASARRVGAVTCVDAAQAAPHLALDVQAWGADFVVFSGHKVCGPNGIGVLWGQRELLESMPPFLGGGGMIRQVTTSGFEPAEIPEKFEAGTPPIVEAIALAAAVKYVGAIGLDRIHRYEVQLCERAHEKLAGLAGLKIFGPPPADKGGIFSFVLQGVHAHDIAHGLDQRGVAVRAGHHCTMPLHRHLGVAATARASFYFYNTLEEVDVFVDALVELRGLLAPRGRRRKS